MDATAGDPWQSRRHLQEHGIELESFGTQSGGETLQRVISGSADLGIGVGTGAMRAFAGGVPIRVLAVSFTAAAIGRHPKALNDVTTVLGVSLDVSD